MVVYTLEQRWEVGLQSIYKRCRFWQKKSSFQMKLILILAVNQTSKIVAFGAQKTRRHTLKTSHCLVRIFWCRGIIGPFFFENRQGAAVTVNGDRYRVILNEFLFTKIEEENICNIWFQQDDATCNIAEAILDVLRPVLEDHIISRRADVVWPPRSCDLTPFGLLFVGCR